MSPQTTTQINACDAVVSLEDEAAVMFDISGSGNEVSMDLTNELGELHTFQARWPVRLACKSDATVNLKVIYTQATKEGMDLLKDWFFNYHGLARQIQIDLPDSAIGSDRYSFDCLLESLAIPVVSNDANPILVSAVLRPTGEFTLATIAS